MKEIVFEFNEGKKICTDGLLQDLFDGRIDINKLLKNEEQRKILAEAVHAVEEFIASAENADLIEYY